MRPACVDCRLGPTATCSAAAWSQCACQAPLSARRACARLLTAASAAADDIYRPDVVFRDPKNTFRGLKNYQTIFWSLRFHGSLFFTALHVDVSRLWQLEETVLRCAPGSARLGWRVPGSAGPPTGWCCAAC